MNHHVGLLMCRPGILSCYAAWDYGD